MNLQFERSQRSTDLPSVAPERRTHRQKPGRAWTTTLTVLLLVGLTAGGAWAASSDGRHAGPVPAGPGADFATVEAAALDALAWASQETGPADQGRVRVGTIHVRSDGRYAYGPPIRSQETLWARRPPVLRFSLGPEDVASYVVYPKTGTTRVDRLNEQPSPGLRRIVDEVDPQRRPLYLLTPSQRVVRYAARMTSVVAGRGMTPIRVSGEPSLADAGTMADAVARTWRALFAPSSPSVSATP